MIFALLSHTIWQARGSPEQAVRSQPNSGPLSMPALVCILWKCVSCRR